MRFIAHRGSWKQTSEKNTRAAFQQALEHGFGIETDLRDFNGKLVISHDPAIDPSLTADEFFSMCNLHRSATPLALNIKADGLQQLLWVISTSFPEIVFFVFDMSIPDTLGYLRKNFPVYLRCSEYEHPSIELLNRAEGIWLDAFESEWYDAKLLNSFLSMDKAVCIVSPELHGRPHESQWLRLKGWKLHHHNKFMLCTDHPQEAAEFFHGQPD